MHYHHGQPPLQPAASRGQMGHPPLCCICSPEASFEGRPASNFERGSAYRVEAPSDITAASQRTAERGCTAGTTYAGEERAATADSILCRASEATIEVAAQALAINLCSLIPFEPPLRTCETAERWRCWRR